MPGRQLDVVLEGQRYLEAPRWHEGRVWVSDFYAGEVVSARADGSDRRVEAIVPEQPSGLGWLPDGRLLIVSMRDARLLRREPEGSLVTHADVRPFVREQPNDMVVDRHGRAYVGDFGFNPLNGETALTAGLVRVEPDGTATAAAAGLWFPNGSVITPEGELLVAETFGNRISAFTMAADGVLGPRRDWARFGPTPEGLSPREAMGAAVIASDGCGLDAEGLLWVADVLRPRVIRVRTGGEIAEEIATPMLAFACMLGGHDGRTLFICAAPDPSERRRRTARESQLLAARVDVPHAGRP